MRFPIFLHDYQTFEQGHQPRRPCLSERFLLSGCPLFFQGSPCSPLPCGNPATLCAISLPGMAVSVGGLAMLTKSLIALYVLRLYVFRSRGRVTVCVGKADWLPGGVLDWYAIARADLVAIGALLRIGSQGRGLGCIVARFAIVGRVVCVVVGFGEVPE